MTVADGWLEGLGEEGRQLASPVVRLLLTEAPRLAVTVQQGMLAFGPFRYRYASGRSGESALLTLAVRKHGLSLYVNCVEDGRYLLATHLPNLGKVRAGISCLRFRRLSELDDAAFRNLIRAAAVSRGGGQVDGEK